MQCPRCFKSDVTLVNGTHYVCNNSTCVDDNGRQTQFSMIIDEKICFPYNEIFIKRNISKFYRKPYLELG